MCSLVYGRRHCGRDKSSILLAAAQTAKALLQAVAHAPASGVAPSDANAVVEGRFDVVIGADRTISGTQAGITVARGHLNARVANLLLVFECLFERVRWFALALEIAR
jgi:hypothetical protein